MRKTGKARKLRKWKGWAIATKTGELRQVTVDREYKPCLPTYRSELRRFKVEIKETRR